VAVDPVAGGWRWGRRGAAWPDGRRGGRWPAGGRRWPRPRCVEGAVDLDVTGLGGPRCCQYARRRRDLQPALV